MGMIFCKGCGKEIHETAPSCPHCGALQGVTPHVGTTESLPEGIKGWSWGAFILGPIWAMANRTWIGALAFVPYVGFIMSIILGFKGREWAWKNQQWESVEHFNKVQKKWSVWAVGLIILLTTIGIIVGVSGKASELIDKARQKANLGSAEVKLVKDGHLQSCPSHTVDQMVEGFMASPSWKSGKGGDGKAYVNIEGGITFHDKPVRAMIQFIVEGDNFSFNAFEMNGVPSANIIAIGLLGKMCENAVAEASPASGEKIEPEAPDLSSLAGQVPEAVLDQPLNGTYERYEDGKPDSNAAEITLVVVKQGKVKITGNSTWVGNAETGNVNTGEIEGLAEIKANTIHFDNECKFDIKTSADSLVVANEAGDCGGLNVSFQGIYKKANK